MSEWSDSLDPTQVTPLDSGRSYGQPQPQTDGLDPGTPGGPSPFNGVGPTSEPVATDPLWLDPTDKHHLRKTRMPNFGPGPDVDVTTLRQAGLRQAHDMYAKFIRTATDFDHRTEEDIPDLDAERRDNDLAELHHRYAGGEGAIKQDQAGEHYYSLEHPSGWEARHYALNPQVDLHHPGQKDGPVTQVHIGDGSNQVHSGFGAGQISHTLNHFVHHNAADYEALPHLNEWINMNRKHGDVPIEERSPFSLRAALYAAKKERHSRDDSQ